MKSIISQVKKCYLCGSYHQIEEHHIFGGNPNRKKSERLGLKVYLCSFCHRDNKQGVHANREKGRYLKRLAQEKYMECYQKDKEAFIKEFGKWES